MSEFNTLQWKTVGQDNSALSSMSFLTEKREGLATLLHFGGKEECSKVNRESKGKKGIQYHHDLEQYWKFVPMTIVSPAIPEFFCAPANTTPCFSTSMGRERKFEEKSPTRIVFEGTWGVLWNSTPKRNLLRKKCLFLWSFDILNLRNLVNTKSFKNIFKNLAVIQKTNPTMNSLVCTVIDVFCVRWKFPF